MARRCCCDGDGGGNGTGCFTFLCLSDTPNTYNNHAGDLLVVNNSETALIYITVEDICAQCGEVLDTNLANADLVWDQNRTAHDLAGFDLAVTGAAGSSVTFGNTTAGELFADETRAALINLAGTPDTNVSVYSTHIELQAPYTALIPDAGQTAPDLRFYEDQANGSNYVSFEARASLGTTSVYYWPLADGNADQVLTTDGMGQLSWTDNLTAGDVEEVIRSGSDPAGAPGVGEDLAVNIVDGSLWYNDGGGNWVEFNWAATDKNLATPSLVWTADTTAHDLDNYKCYILGEGDDAEFGIAAGGDWAAGNDPSSYLWIYRNAANLTTINSDGDSAEVWTFRDGGTDEVSAQVRSVNVSGRYSQLEVLNGPNESDNVAILNAHFTHLLSSYLGTTASELRFHEGGDAVSTNYVGFKAPDTLASDTTYTWPALDGSPGEQLTTNGSGVLSWSAAGAGTDTNFANTNLTFDGNWTHNLQGAGPTNYNVTVTGTGTSTINLVNTSGGEVTLSNTLAELNFNGGSGLAKLTIIDGTTTNTNTTFALAPITGGTAPTLRFYEDQANGSNYVGFKAPASLTAAPDVVYTLPAADGTPNQVLTTNGSAVLSWGPGAGVTIYTYDFTIGDWSGPSGGLYSITRTAAQTGIVAPKLIQVYENDGSDNLTFVLTHDATFLSNGDVRIRVSETPDGRFDGRLVVMG